MDKFLYEIFKNLPDHQVPGTLHAKTMRKVIFHRLRIMIFFLLGIIALSLGVSLLHFYNQIVESDFIESLRTVVSTFEFNWDSLQDSFSYILSFTPISAGIITLINFVVLALIVRILYIFNRIKESAL